MIEKIDYLLFVWKNLSFSCSVSLSLNLASLSLSLSDSLLCVVELEWMLSEVGVLKTELEAPPKQEIRDVMDSALRQSGRGDDDSDEDDW